MFGNIDPYSIATNGLISTNPKSIIIDPLGYYVIDIEEEIVEIPRKLNIGGIRGGRSKKHEETVKVKKVKVSVKFNDEKIKDFSKEFYLKNINLTVSDANINDDHTQLTIIIKDISIMDKDIDKPKKVVKVINIK